MTDNGWKLLFDGSVIAVVSHPRLSLSGDAIHIEMALGRREMPDVLLNSQGDDSKTFELSVLGVVVAKGMLLLRGCGFQRCEDTSRVTSLVFYCDPENIVRGHFLHVH